MPSSQRGQQCTYTDCPTDMGMWVLVEAVVVVAAIIAVAVSSRWW